MLTRTVHTIALLIVLLSNKHTNTRGDVQLYTHTRQSPGPGNSELTQKRETEISGWQTEQMKMNAEFSALQIGKQDNSAHAEWLHAAVYFGLQNVIICLLLLLLVLLMSYTLSWRLFNMNFVNVEWELAGPLFYSDGRRLQRYLRSVLLGFELNSELH